MARIKSSPEDFYVKELADIELGEEGRFAYFLLKKKGKTTHEALEEVARHLRVEPSRIRFGGLKDKEAVTEQYISVERPPVVKEIEGEELSLKFLGYSDEPMDIGRIEGNLFRVVVRGVGKRKLRYLRDRVDFVERFGFENYFGEQRFGSVKNAEEFVAKLLLRGDYEGALKTYLTSLKDKRRKRELLRSWGRWREFLKHMPQRSTPERRVVEELMKGKSYREAFESLPRSIKLMLLFTYQSYLWNRYLNTFIVRYFKHCSVPFLRWRLSFITEMDERVFEEVRELEIPFLGKKVKPKSKKVEVIMREVLAEEGITEEMLGKKIGNLKLFTDGLRRAFVHPRDMKVLKEGEDYVELSFILPPGSYATVLLRKLLCSPLEV